jgi:hypothetical protein
MSRLLGGVAGGSGVRGWQLDEATMLNPIARMSTPKNTKLCDFTSTNNNDFICTPIAPPAPEENFMRLNLLC